MQSRLILQLIRFVVIVVMNDDHNNYNEDDDDDDDDVFVAIVYLSYLFFVFNALWHFL